jgi:hypothetical protein
MLDLQMVRRANPTVDLCYFFGSSTSPEIREKHLEEMLTFYWKRLDMLLVTLGYPSNLYTYKSLKKDFKRTFLFGVMLGSMHAMVSEGSSAAA